MDLDFKVLLFTVTDLLEHLFCPRFTYFEKYLRIPEHQERRKKVVRGRDLHAQRAKANPTYLRKRLSVVRKLTDVELASSALHLHGKVDEILFFKDGTCGPLDYKFTTFRGRLFRTHRLQLAAYGLLIQQVFNLPVERGHIVYTREGNHVETVQFRRRDSVAIQSALNEMVRVIQSGWLPRRRGPRYCLDCCYRNICV